MKEDHDLIYFKMNLLQAEIKMNGMIAGNKVSEINREPPKYTEDDFNDLIEEHDIHHNKFPFYSGE